MSVGVIKQRMKELSKFLNDLLDTRKCIISPLIFFNIFDSKHFLDFVDDKGLRRNVLEILRDEQQKRISDILKQFSSLVSSPQFSGMERLSFSRMSGNKNQYGQAGKKSVRHSTIRNSFAGMGNTSEMQNQPIGVKKSTSANCLLNSQYSHRGGMNRSFLAPDISEVVGCYINKPAHVVVDTLLENLNNAFVQNKNEHMN